MIKTEVFMTLNLTGLRHGPNNLKDGSCWYSSNLFRNTKMAIRYSMYYDEPILILDYTNYSEQFYIDLVNMYVNYVRTKNEAEKSKFYLEWRNEVVKIEPEKYDAYKLTQEQAQEILNKNKHLFAKIDDLLAEKLLIAEINEL